MIQYCKRCGAEIGTGNRCPQCKRAVQREPTAEQRAVRRTRRRTVWMALAFAALLGGLLPALCTWTDYLSKWELRLLDEVDQASFEKVRQMAYAGDPYYQVKYADIILTSKLGGWITPKPAVLGPGETTGQWMDEACRFILAAWDSPATTDHSTLLFHRLHMNHSAWESIRNRYACPLYDNDPGIRRRMDGIDAALYKRFAGHPPAAENPQAK